MNNQRLTEEQVQQRLSAVLTPGHPFKERAYDLMERLAEGSAATEFLGLICVEYRDGSYYGVPR